MTPTTLEDEIAELITAVDDLAHRMNNDLALQPAANCAYWNLRAAREALRTLTPA